MAINKKIINFKKAEDFTKEYEAGNILEKSLVFIDDTHQIVTHNTVFDGNIPNWRAMENEAGYIKNKPELGFSVYYKDEEIDIEQKEIVRSVKSIIAKWNDYGSSFNGPDVNYDDTFGEYSFNIGVESYTNGMLSIASGQSNVAKGDVSFVGGMFNVANNFAEVAFGTFNKSTEKTIFTIGNGDGTMSRHNAFEIRDNGDVYIADTSADVDKTEYPMIKLQDALNKVGGAELNADWDAEEGQAGYIKNKPFGYEYELVFSADNVSLTSKAGNGYGGFTLDTSKLYDSNGVYKIVLNNKVYDNIKPYYSNLSNDYTGSSQPLYQNSDFIFYNFGSTDCNIYTKEIYEDLSLRFYKLNIETIDSKYLPIVQQTGNSETSIMSQKAVTEALANVGGSSEVNADWDAEEGEAGFIKNKPVVEVEPEELVYQDNFEKYISVYGKNEGKKLIDFDEIERILKLGDKYIVEINGIKYPCVCFWSGIYENVCNNWTLSSDNKSTHPVNDADFIITNPYNNRQGFYFYWKTEFGDNVNLKIYHITNPVKKFDPKYLPIVQNPGDSETFTMSQKAVTDNFINKSEFWTGTQDEYDAITNKDSNTFYFIKEG